MNQRISVRPKVVNARPKVGFARHISRLPHDPINNQSCKNCENRINHRNIKYTACMRPCTRDPKHVFISTCHYILGIHYLDLPISCLSGSGARNLVVPDSNCQTKDSECWAYSESDHQAPPQNDLYHLLYNRQYPHV